MTGGFVAKQPLDPGLSLAPSRTLNATFKKKLGVILDLIKLIILKNIYQVASSLIAKVSKSGVHNQSSLLPTLADLGS